MKGQPLGIPAVLVAGALSAMVFPVPNEGVKKIIARIKIMVFLFINLPPLIHC